MLDTLSSAQFDGAMALCKACTAPVSRITSFHPGIAPAMTAADMCRCGFVFGGANEGVVAEYNALETNLETDEHGSPVSLEPADWLVFFVPGLQRQWWHPFAHKRHKHCFVMRRGSTGYLLVEPWWHRMMISTLTATQARKFLIWGARGDVLLVREKIPGAGSQVRGWMTCAALTSYLLGRSYRVWTPHGLYRRLLQEQGVLRVNPLFLLQERL
jgi:hypothetical protein